MSLKLTSRSVATCVFLASLYATLSTQSRSDEPDPVAYARIRDEGLNRSRVMDYATQLVDGIGARLTGSPNLDEAVAWSLQRLTSDGHTNVHKESWGEFGMGWRQRNVWVRLVEPDVSNFIAYAVPWSPATRGTVRADVIAVRAPENERALEALRGQLRGKIVLLASAPSPPIAIPIEAPLFERLSETDLAGYAAAAADAPPEDKQFERIATTIEFNERVGRFFGSEGVRAVLVPSGNNPKGGASGGTLYVDSNFTFAGWLAHRREHASTVPRVVIALEHYGRMQRLLERNVRVVVELNVDTEFTGDNVEGFNVFADIAGVNDVRKEEFVLVGAHLDSWHAGTGATDDGAGVIIAMEAMRILRAIGVQPQRTIRLALWTGEEQLGLGSGRYVRQHLATVPRAETSAQARIPEMFRRRAGAIVPKREHALLSAYYNLDAGSGRIRAVAIANNKALIPIVRHWIAPLRDLGLTTIAERSDCGGDCTFFEEIGIPTPSFKQDPLDYDTRTHHTNIDTYERLIPEDLRQAAVVVATMLYNTATRDELLPRVRSMP